MVQADAADMDGDGDMDVLSASHEDDKIAWYENTDGQGTFSTQKTITTQADTARSVYAADMDGDGDMDVLSASYTDNKIAWYENTDGQGTFSTQKTITTQADDATSVYAADIDGDGNLDVLSASYNDDKIAWYENTQTTNFTYGSAAGTAGGYAIDASTRISSGGFEKSSRNVVPALNTLGSAPSTGVMNEFAATTASAAELNVMVDADAQLDASMLNKLKDLTSTASELNKISTASSAAQLNALSTTATAADLNAAGSVLVAGANSSLVLGLLDLKKGADMLLATSGDLLSQASIAYFEDGSYVVAFRSDPDPSSGNTQTIYARRFDKDHNALDAEFITVSKFSHKNQIYPKVITLKGDSTGKFVVFFSSMDQWGSGYKLFAKMYNASGYPIPKSTLEHGVQTDASYGVEEEFRVGTYDTDSSQDIYSALALNDGGFIAVWNMRTGSTSNIYAKRFNGAGDPVPKPYADQAGENDGEGNYEFLLSDNAKTQYFGDIAAYGDGMAVLYREYVSSTIYAKLDLFDASFLKTGATHDIITSPTGAGQIEQLSNGNFVVVSYLNDPNKIVAQVVDSTGATLGSQIKVSTLNSAAHEQRYPNIATLSDRFAVVWDHLKGDEDGSSSVFMQQYQNDGTAIGNNVKVNSVTEGSQGLGGKPNVATYGDDILVVYSNQGTNLTANLFTRVVSKINVATLDTTNIGADLTVTAAELNAHAKDLGSVLSSNVLTFNRSKINSIDKLGDASISQFEVLTGLQMRCSDSSKATEAECLYEEVTSGAPLTATDANYLNAEECEAYGKSLTFGYYGTKSAGYYWGGTSSWSSRQSGCWKSRDDMVFFNTAETTVNCDLQVSGDPYPCIQKTGNTWGIHRCSDASKATETECVATNNTWNSGLDVTKLNSYSSIDRVAVAGNSVTSTFATTSCQEPWSARTTTSTCALVKNAPSRRPASTGARLASMAITKQATMKQRVLVVSS